MRRALAITLALFAVVYAIARVRYAPPPAALADASGERFSAGRARLVQQAIVGDGATRHVGSPGNARARGVIAAELTRLGWTVEEQRAFACSYHGMCAPVVNVVGRLPGREPSIPGVLLSAHYDSVLVSPGASDDGVGAATVLEAARALAEGPRPRRTVVALLSDAEESGLLGMEAFVRDHALARSIRTTVNVDARGSRGPSFMFETSRGNSGLVSAMAAHLPRPVTTSLFYEIYKRMPNDTDFSISKTIASGVNFANTAGIESYHTPLDDLTSADPGTLQHHGDHALAMIRAFAEDDGAVRADAASDAVWFDVMALGIVHWPASWSLLLALVALALVVGHAVRARAFDAGLASFLSIAAGIVAALLVGLGLRAGGALPAPWVAEPLPALLALHAAAAAATLLALQRLAARSTPRALWAGTWIGWWIAGAATASQAEGMSYLFVVPTLAAALSGALPFAAACVLPAAVAAVLVLALATNLYESMGFVFPPLVAIPTVLLSTTIAPMLIDLPRALARRAPLALGAVALVAAVGAWAAPKWSASHPQRANVVFRQDEGVARVFLDTSWGAASWGKPPAPMAAALGLTGAEPSSRREPALPWTLPAPLVDAAPVDEEGPASEVLSAKDEGPVRRVRVRVRSPRGAPALALVFPRTRRVEAKVEGRQASLRAVAGGSLLGLFGVPSAGLVLDLEAPGAEPIAFTLLDRSAGVPAGSKAEAAVRARPKDVVPSQDGDVTVLTSRFAL